MAELQFKEQNRQTESLSLSEKFKKLDPPWTTQHCGDWKENLENFLDPENCFYKKREFAGNLLKIIGKEHRKENLIRLVWEKLRLFEDIAFPLAINHRDHVVHSVFVYLLGLYLYENKKIREKINSILKCDIEKWSASLFRGNTNEQEEFLFRWKLAACLHDLAYPFKIAIEQLEKCWPHSGNNTTPTVSLSLWDNPEEMSVPLLTNQGSMACIPEPSNGKHDLLDLLFYALKRRHSITNYCPDCFKREVIDYVKNVGGVREDRNNRKHNFVNHGLLSALIVLKNTHELYRNNSSCTSNSWKRQNFYGSILDAASAIFLHSMHGKIDSLKQRVCFTKHPIAYLLILCDELQDWDRIPGKSDHGNNNNTPTIEDFNVEVSSNNTAIDIKIFLKNSSDEFIGKKQRTIEKKLDQSEIKIEFSQQ